MKTERLIGILSVLLQRDKVTAPELAELFEVSRRTINRDIETLCTAGIPIMTARGVNGGIQIMDGYRVDRTVLSNSDMQAILSGLKSLDSVSRTNRYLQLMEKLSAGTASSLSGDNHILINLSAWDKAAVSKRIELIHKAIESCNYLCFHYSSPSGESNRKIEPYYLIFQWSNWYVWGWCLKRQDFRLFKLNRMTAVSAGERFTKRDLPYPDLSNDRLFPHNHMVKAIIQPEYRFRILDDYGAESIAEQADGTFLFSFGFTDFESIISWVLSFGKGIELLEPHELREGLKHFGEDLVKKYS
ncbi:YafY family transcriptional regulator [Streptococcus chenjunshii]|uniref:YafY family transcriptional regulator n=1 Tax=Streptococcus chenjunshii TaxID=2173853 RepID=A0A372KKR6_9STRE|nr:YafY family protein [Streptococcus chenjunshii]AXQ79382.1 YafY family transcriptional regulator [Streptococcus chenjunshii]RFU50078.1 YafY family transcriptional regulator [Streptococcus chenjunshii]RFU52891.1 YafY family transcriptional regulator [Streptococcus chenjunshii]